MGRKRQGTMSDEETLLRYEQGGTVAQLALVEGISEHGIHGRLVSARAARRKSPAVMEAQRRRTAEAHWRAGKAVDEVLERIALEREPSPVVRFVDALEALTARLALL